MTTQKGRYIGILLGVVLLLMSACSVGSATGSQSALQLLQKSATAMKQLKSVHLAMRTTSAIKLAATPTGTTRIPQNLTFTVTANGDAAMPDKTALRLTLGTGSLNFNVSEITIGNKLYIQNSKGQWYVLDKSKLEGKNTTPLSGTNVPDQNLLLSLAQHSKITDHGTQALNGEQLRHITVSLDKDGLKQFLASDKQFSKQFGQQNIDKLLASLKTFQASVDFWIDEATSYVHRTELKLSLNVDTSAFITLAKTTATHTASPNVTLNLDAVVDLSKFNQPVTITAPANAIPTDNPFAIFE